MITDWPQFIYVVLTALALLAGLVSVVYTLPKVKSHWRLAYWGGLLLAGTLTAALVFGLLGFFGVQVPGPLVLYTLETAIFLTALQLNLVPYIHRWERRRDKA